MLKQFFESPDWRQAICKIEKIVTENSLVPEATSMFYGDKSYKHSKDNSYKSYKMIN
jgi:hypothetical protein